MVGRPTFSGTKITESSYHTHNASHISYITKFPTTGVAFLMIPKGVANPGEGPLMCSGKSYSVFPCFILVSEETRTDLRDVANPKENSDELFIFFLPVLSPDSQQITD